MAGALPLEREARLTPPADSDGKFLLFHQFPIQTRRHSHIARPGFHNPGPTAEASSVQWISVVNQGLRTEIGPRWWAWTFSINQLQASTSLGPPVLSMALCK
jgi:hypothetical protein